MTGAPPRKAKEKRAGEQEHPFLLKDDLGSVVALVDMSGKVVERVFYGTRGAPTLVGGRLGDYDQDEDVDLADFAAVRLRCLRCDKWEMSVHGFAVDT